MKKFLTRLLVFVVLTSLAYTAGVIVVGVFFPDKYKKNLKYVLGGNGYLFTRVRQADSVKKNIDVLVIGSSHAYRGYDPRIFAANGLKMFNLGSSSQSMLQTEVLLKQYLDRIHPKLVIYDIYPVFLGSNGIEAGLDVVSNGHVDMNLLNMALRINSIEVYNTMIYSCFREIAGLNRDFNEVLKKDSDTYIPGGFVQSYKVLAAKDQIHLKPYTYKLNKDQVSALRRIVSLFKQRSLPFILLQAPLPVKRYAGITNNNSIDSLLGKIGTYYNFNKILSLSDSMFVDDSHLNQWGVDKYNVALLKHLKLGRSAMTGSAKKITR